jgi:hypothetical protein
MSHHERSKFPLAAPAILATLLMTVGAVSFSPASADTQTYSGSATVLSISSLLASQSFGAATLASSGGWSSAPMSEIQNNLASADMLTSSSLGVGQQAESQAATGNLVLLPGTPAEVDSDFAMSRAFATCSSVFGDTELGNLTVAGQAVSVTGAPNQKVSMPGVLDLVINEQTTTSSGITVNALDLTTAGGTQILVDSSSSSISCSSIAGLSAPPAGNIRVQPNHGVPGTPGCVDFTTGGGWITPPAPYSGGKSTFGFVAGYKNGGTNPRGEVEYHDHTSGQFNIHSLDVLYYLCGPNTNSRVFGGDAELNHVSGYCYEVYIQDNGEPGHGVDYFAIWLWPPGTPCGSPPTGFTASYANGNYLGGGNIEIHSK